MDKNERTLKVIFTTGGSGSTTCKASLPVTWLRQLGIDKDNREVIAILEDDKIIIKKK